MDNCKVRNIRPTTDSVQVILYNGSILEAKSLVVCAGAWTNQILESLG